MAGRLFIVYQPNAYRETHETRYVVDIKPLHQLGAMRFDSFDADLQHVRDLFGGVTFCN